MRGDACPPRPRPSSKRRTAREVTTGCCWPGAISPAASSPRWCGGSSCCPCQLGGPAADGVNFSDERAGDGKVSETLVGEATTSNFVTLQRGSTWASGGRWGRRTSKTQLAIVLRGSQAYADVRPRIEKGNPVQTSN